MKKGGTSVVYAVILRSHVKIGWTTDPVRRLRQHRARYGEGCRMVGTQPGGRTEEATLHARFKLWRVKPEWFLHTQEIAAWIETLTPFDEPKPESAPHPNRVLSSDDGVDALMRSGIGRKSIAEFFNVKADLVGRAVARARDGTNSPRTPHAKARLTSIHSSGIEHRPVAIETVAAAARDFTDYDLLNGDALEIHECADLLREWGAAAA